MYGRSPKITILLGISFLATFVTAFTIIVKIMTIEKGALKPTFGISTGTLTLACCAYILISRRKSITWPPRRPILHSSRCTTIPQYFLDTIAYI